MNNLMSVKLQSHRSTARAATAAPTIAKRKTCNPKGIGLSHYVLMDKKAAK